MKYRNKKVTIDGILFDSLLEADLYKTLKLLKSAGKIESIECHLPYELHGHKDELICKYKVDFRIVVGKTTKHYRHIEAKGIWTSTARLKAKMFRAEYGPLEIHTAKEHWKL